jgi:hypothetical protein
MLYLESPAGSGQNSGFSTCIKAGKPVRCDWNDKSQVCQDRTGNIVGDLNVQGEAYAHTLAAFKKAFPEFEKNGTGKKMPIVCFLQFCTF